MSRSSGRGCPSGLATTAIPRSTGWHKTKSPQRDFRWVTCHCGKKVSTWVGAYGPRSETHYAPCGLPCRGASETLAKSQRYYFEGRSHGNECSCRKDL